MLNYGLVNMREVNVERNVIVIGASIAGSISAYLLARAGLGVTLIDPQSVPGVKACGEGLSTIGQNYLSSLGLWGEELSEAAYPFYGYEIHFDEASRLQLSSAEEVQGFGISRELLDAYLFQKVSELSAIEVRRARARKFHRDQSVWRVTLSDGSELCSDELIVATGAASLKDSGLQIDQKREAEARFGVALRCEGYWRENCPNNVVIFNRHEGQYIITPLGPERINLSMLLSSERTPSHSSADLANVAMQLASERGFQILKTSRLKGVNQIHSSQLDSKELNAFFVGDAIERMDPVGGMGMTHAIYSAALAVSSILEPYRSRECALAGYYARRQNAVRVLRAITYLSYGLNVSNHRVLRVLLKNWPGLALSLNKWLKSAFPSPEQGRALQMRCSKQVKVVKPVAEQSFIPANFQENYL